MDAVEMSVLRIRVEGDVTSFRYPHFVQGVHLTYEMPPPATIYGHICSAAGDLLPPAALQFAYHFRYAAKFEDYEHLHFYGKRYTMNPFRRELLFRPQLTLYLAVRDESLITLPDLQRLFQKPAYCVVLGRSQDLMHYQEASIVTLQPADRAYYDGTLLNLEDAARIGGRFFAATMPRYINENRQPQWGQYALLPHSDKPPIYPSDEPVTGTLQMETQEPLSIQVDPDIEHPYQPNLYRGVMWHVWQQ